MRFAVGSNTFQNLDLTCLKFAYPTLSKEYAYLYSFKASSRTIGKYVDEGHFEETNITISRENSRPLMEKGFEKIYDKIDTIFCIFKDAKTKVYSGLLEVSNYKDHNRAGTLDEYKEELKKFLTVGLNLDLCHIHKITILLKIRSISKQTSRLTLLRKGLIRPVVGSTR